jgi:hypothetical protein
MTWLNLILGEGYRVGVADESPVLKMLAMTGVIFLSLRSARQAVAVLPPPAPFLRSDADFHVRRTPTTLPTA